MLKKPVFFLLFSLSFAATAFSGEAENYISKGNQFVKAQDYNNAVKEYKLALTADPQNASANLLLGITYANLKEYDKALRYAQNAVRLDPSFSAYYNLALIYVSTDNIAKALEMFDNALGTNPSSYRVHYQKGLVYSSQGEYVKAAESYEQTLKLNPQFDQAYLALGGAYYYQGDKVRAKKQADALRKIGQEQKAADLETWLKEKEKGSPVSSL